MTSFDSDAPIGFSLQGAVPLFLIFFLTFLGMAPLGLTDYGTIAPPLGLLALFYWAVYRPDLVGPFAAFLAGFVTDTLSGTALGVYAFIFVATYGMASGQRQLFLAHSFFILWWGFAMVAVFSGAFSWFINAVVGGAFMPLRPVLFQALTAVAFFPLIAGLCGFAQKLMLGEK